MIPTVQKNSESYTASLIHDEEENELTDGELQGTTTDETDDGGY